jgi:hypothetical protein
MQAGLFRNGAVAPFLFSFSQCALAHGTQPYPGQESLQTAKNGGRQIKRKEVQ